MSESYIDDPALRVAVYAAKVNGDRVLIDL